MALVLRWLSGRDGMNIVTRNSLHLDDEKHTRPLLPLLLFLPLVFCPFCTFSLLSVLLPSSPGNKPCLPPSASSPLLPVTPPFSSAHCNLPTSLLVHRTDLTRKAMSGGSSNSCRTSLSNVVYRIDSQEKMSTFFFF